MGTTPSPAGAPGSTDSALPVSEPDHGTRAGDVPRDHAGPVGTGARPCRGRVARLAPAALRCTRHADARGRAPPARAQEPLCAHHGARDGEAAPTGRGGSGEMR